MFGEQSPAKGDVFCKLAAVRVCRVYRGWDSLQYIGGVGL